MKKIRKPGQAKSCRFHLPKPPFHTTEISCVECHDAESGDGGGSRVVSGSGSESDGEGEGAPPAAKQGPRFALNIAQSALSMWMAQHNPSVSVVCRCNNNIRYIVSAAVSWYMAMYSSKKRNKENEDAMDWCISNVARKVDQLDADTAAGEPAVSTFSRGRRQCT